MINSLPLLNLPLIIHRYGPNNLFCSHYPFLSAYRSSSITSPEQKNTVSGSVSDAITRQPLPNVNISIVGTSGGGTTNTAGEFSLILTRIPAVLYFSYMGYSIGSYQVNNPNTNNIRILLNPEAKEIDEVTIRAEKISKVIRGDTLNIVYYEIDGNRIIMVGNPYRHQQDQRIYLTDHEGNILDVLKI